jgi:hypothetical protein
MAGSLVSQLEKAILDKSDTGELPTCQFSKRLIDEQDYLLQTLLLLNLNDLVHSV